MKTKKQQFKEELKSLCDNLDVPNHPRFKIFDDGKIYFKVPYLEYNYSYDENHEDRGFLSAEFLSIQEILINIIVREANLISSKLIDFNFDLKNEISLLADSDLEVAISLARCYFENEPEKAMKWKTLPFDAKKIYTKIYD